MRAVIQRVKKAAVIIDNSESRSIGAGLLIFLGIESADNAEDIQWLSTKISKLRIFDDKASVMNESVIDTKGDIMLISQFTLHAKTKKGNRPSYIQSAAPGHSKPLYEQFIKQLSILINKEVIGGEFGAHMDVELINDGPVTILIDTKNKE